MYSITFYIDFFTIDKKKFIIPFTVSETAVYFNFDVEIIKDTSKPDFRIDISNFEASVLCI